MVMTEALGFNSLAGARDFPLLHNVQIGCFGVYPASSSVGTWGSFPQESEPLGFEAGCASMSSADIKNKWCCSSKSLCVLFWCDA
jgi:hypothetical protein